MQAVSQHRGLLREARRLEVQRLPRAWAPLIPTAQGSKQCSHGRCTSGFARGVGFNSFTRSPTCSHAPARRLHRACDGNRSHAAACEWCPTVAPCGRCRAPRGRIPSHDGLRCQRQPHARLSGGAHHADGTRRAAPRSTFPRDLAVHGCAAAAIFHNVRGADHRPTCRPNVFFDQCRHGDAPARPLLANDHGSPCTIAHDPHDDGRRTRCDALGDHGFSRLYVRACRSSIGQLCASLHAYRCTHTSHGPGPRPGHGPGPIPHSRSCSCSCSFFRPPCRSSFSFSSSWWRLCRGPYTKDGCSRSRVSVPSRIC